MESIWMKFKLLANFKFKLLLTNNAINILSVIIKWFIICNLYLLIWIRNSKTKMY